MLQFKIMDDTHCEFTKIKGIEGMEYGAQYGSGIIIKDEFHIVGGWMTNNHIKYNRNTQKCEVLHDLGALNWDYIQLPGSTKIGNKCLLFGGSNDYECNDTIYEYDVVNNAWSQLPSRIPEALTAPSCISVLNEQLIILIGGSDVHGDVFSDRIYIYSVGKGTFKLSPITCPDKSCYQAITTNDKHKDQLTTFGYIRGLWSDSGIDNHLFPPEYLIRIICGYYLNEWAHLFDCKTGKHYKINVFDIINC